MKFNAESLEWALTHLLNLSDTDIFPPAFEFQAIREHWTAQGGVRQWFLRQDPGEWTWGTQRRCLAPKHRFGFRISTQLDPLDSIALAALVHRIGSDIEKKRVLASRQIVHSYRFKPASDGRMYDPDYGWDSFRAKSKELVAGDGITHVVVADIADFFPRLYSHPLENEVADCTTKHRATALAVLRALKQLNQTISYGLPVGPSPSRLLAELALTIVDKTLLDANVIYCRFSDDFRIFCKSSREAHERLALLAQVLFEGLGLTLQQHKTSILSASRFRRLIVSPQRQIRSRLSQQFQEILDDLGIHNPYKPIDYKHLSPQKKSMVDSMNLGQVLEEQIDCGEELDILVTAFVLRRLAQLEDANHIDTVLDNLDTLYPVFPDAVRYIASLTSLHANRRRSLGARLLAALDDTVSGHLEFHRCWVLNVFAESADWNNEKTLATLQKRWDDVFSRRELILARGKAGHSQWFKSQKVHFGNLGPWERRAFLYAASCLPGDEARHWWKGLKEAGALSTLDQAVIVYAKNHPIC